MKVNVTAPVKIDSKLYVKGIQEVPDALQSHWYFLACVSNHRIQILEKPKAEEPATIDPKTVAPSEPPQIDTDPADPVIDSGEASLEEEKEIESPKGESSKGNKKNKNK